MIWRFLDQLEPFIVRVFTDNRGIILNYLFAASDSLHLLLCLLLPNPLPFYLRLEPSFRNEAFLVDSLESVGFELALPVTLVYLCFYLI